MRESKRGLTFKIPRSTSLVVIHIDQCVSTGSIAFIKYVQICFFHLSTPTFMKELGDLQPMLFYPLVKPYNCNKP